MRSALLLVIGLLSSPLYGAPNSIQNPNFPFGSYCIHNIGGTWILTLRENGEYQLRMSGSNGAVYHRESGSWRFDGSRLTIVPSPSSDNSISTTQDDFRHLYFVEDEAGLPMLVSTYRRNRGSWSTPFLYVFEKMPNQSTDPAPASGTSPAGQESRHP
jgi:hypothetical protein